MNQPTFFVLVYFHLLMHCPHLDLQTILFEPAMRLHFALNMKKK